MNVQEFQDWLGVMGFDKPGGLEQAAKILHMPLATITKFEGGVNPDNSPVSYPYILDLACSALATNLEPWSKFQEAD